MTSRFVQVIVCACLLNLLAPRIEAASFSAGGLRFNKQVKPMQQIRRQNLVPQSLDYSCGAAGLSTLLHYYLDNPISEQEIIVTLLNTIPLDKVLQRKGFSLLDLKTFALSKGYKVTGYKMDVAFLKELNKPVLVPIKYKNYNHFVIVKGIISDRIFLADPAAGNLSMKINKFEEMWTDGIGLVVEPNTEEDKSKTLRNALKIRQENLLIADYKSMQSLVNGALLRTTVFVDEF